MLRTTSANIFMGAPRSKKCRRAMSLRQHRFAPYPIKTNLLLARRIGAQEALGSVGGPDDGDNHVSQSWRCNGPAAVVFPSAGAADALGPFPGTGGEPAQG